MTEALNEIAEKVVDEASFLLFLAALADDWNDEQVKEAVNPSPHYGPGANGWESDTIARFLEAGAAWAKAMPAPRADENVWKRVAFILLAGKCYE